MPMREKSLRTPVPYKFSRIVFLDPQGKEVCCGYHMEPDDGRGYENFDKFEREAEKNLFSAFRKVLEASQHPRFAKDLSDDEIQAALNCMIAVAGYKIEWFFTGWKEEDTPPFEGPRYVWESKKEE